LLLHGGRALRSLLVVTGVLGGAVAVGVHEDCLSSLSIASVKQNGAFALAKPNVNGEARSETSVLGTYKALAKVFSYALKHRLITYNPCVAVEKPRADTQEAHFLSRAEVERLAATLDEQPPYGLMVRLAADTGLRAGELAALRARDIDLLHKEVRVHQNMTHTSAGYVVEVPKTANSRREVPILVDSLLKELRHYLAAHPHRSDPDAGLWPGKVKSHPILTYDRPFDPKGVYRYTFKPAAKSIGLPTLKLHELRHTFATLVLESGAFDMFELSRLMGHASVTITDKVYAHLRKKDYVTQRALFSAFVTGTSARPSGQEQATETN
jgi:integrase